MRPDFQRWVLNAAKKPNTFPAGSLIWSPATHFLFKNCPRAWFFRHILAQGGWDLFSDDLTLHAYLLKYLDMPGSWASRILEKSISKALLDLTDCMDESRPASLLETLQIQVSRSLLRARNEIEREEYLSDPRKSSFFALYYTMNEPVAPDVLWNNIRERFTQFFHLLDDSELLDELASIDPLCWRLPPEFKTFRKGGQIISLRPWLLAIQHHTVWAWSFRINMSGETIDIDFNAENEENCLPERVLSAWCAEKYPGFSLRIRQILLQNNDLSRYILEVPPVSTEFIETSAGAILNCLNRNCEVRAKDFPETENPLTCPFCRFKAICHEFRETKIIFGP